MTPIKRHILIPALAPLLFFAVAATPVQVLGCRNRGWLAVAIAFTSVLSSLGTTIMGAKRRLQSDPNTIWWLISRVILTIPAVALIIPA